MAIFGSILNSRLSANLTELLPANAADPGRADDLVSSPERVAALPAAVREPVIEALVRALDTAFLAGVPLAIVAFLLAFRIKELPLRGAAPSITSDDHGEDHAAR